MLEIETALCNSREMEPSVKCLLDFPVTIGVICYGNHFTLAHRFLVSLYANTDPSLFSIRAGLNAVEGATMELFLNYSKRFKNIELFVEPKNIFKNPLMNKMMLSSPISSNWTIWCDDDTHFTETDWLQRLASKITSDPAMAQWGQLFLISRGDPQILDWIKKASWYRKVPFVRPKEAKEAVEFVFATGGYWATKTDVLRFLDWPDRRLFHAGEDYMLGEALRQNGYRIGNFHHGVKINDASTRNADAPQVRDIIFDEGAVPLPKVIGGP